MTRRSMANRELQYQGHAGLTIAQAIIKSVRSTNEPVFIRGLEVRRLRPWKTTSTSGPLSRSFTASLGLKQPGQHRAGFPKHDVVERLRV